MNKERLWILCGNMTEFQYYRNRICDVMGGVEYDFRYISDEYSILRGYKDEKYICLGNWNRRHRSIEIMIMMRHAGYKEVGFSEVTGIGGETDYKTERERDAMFQNEFISEEEMTI